MPLKERGHSKKAKRSGSSSSHDPEKSSAKRPTSTSPELYCNSCQAIIREMIKKLKHRNSESDVMEAIDEVCNPELYMVYEFPPPEMREGCEAFIMDWEEVVEKELINRDHKKDPKGALVEERVCNEISKACKNVNVKDAPRTDNQIFVDGQPVPLKDGKVNLGGGNEEEL